MWLLFKEEFEDTKGVIRIRISKKNRQHNGQKKKDKERSIKHTHNAEHYANLARCAMGFGVSNGSKLALLGIARFGV
jgi:hypothetical protein